MATDTTITTHRGIAIEERHGGGYFAWVRFGPGEPMNRVTGETAAEVAANIDAGRVDNDGVIG